MGRGVMQGETIGNRFSLLVFYGVENNRSGMLCARAGQEISLSLFLCASRFQSHVYLNYYVALSLNNSLYEARACFKTMFVENKSFYTVVY